MPVPVDVGAMRTVADLAGVLRALRRREARARHGRELTYQQLADRTGWSVSMIGSYLTGAALPPTDRFDALVMALGVGPAEAGALASARDRVADERRRERVDRARRTPVPRQLPSAPTHFVGRDEQLARMDAAAPGEGERSVPVTAITGMAGVGKTALALWWAHRAADRFPDGQIYVNLRGFDPMEPLHPNEALASLLYALGLDSARIPRSPTDRAALYRTTLAERRILILLDNARDAGHVRLLLPGTAPCAVVVTSRDSLAGLVSSEGAVRIGLPVLSAADSATLARDLLGDRADVTPDAVAAIVTRCGRLPLAIRAAAEVAVHRAGVPLASLAGDLRNERTRLDTLDTGDAQTAVRSVLSWSYRSLSPAAARLFRLLGRAPGADLATATIASLATVEPAATHRLMTELTRAHMVTETEPGRYGLHDLLRAYAAELAHADDHQSAPDTVARRVLDQLVHTALAADRVQQPSPYPIDPIIPADGVIV